jgi:L-alanine-DL-glutamate epimerase-like enolase superfamily enzyme
MARDRAPAIESVSVSAYTIPTDRPEADGTFAWASTTLVLVEIDAGGQHGIGYTYADVATARLIRGMLADVVTGMDARNVGACWNAMIHAIRNLGRPGIASMAIAGVDNALWDLKAKLAGLPLYQVLSAQRTRVPIYGSGGFTSYPIDVLQEQLGGWVDQDIGQVKMKIGTYPDQDIERVKAAREAIGPDTQLFVDANGAYTRKQAIAFADRFAELGVVWFEEPVSSDDLAGLHLMRDRGPAGMNIAAGEYGYDSWYFRRMLDAGAVDVLQADATRCAGITGFLRAADICDAFELPFSAHTAPSLHVHPCCAVPRLMNLEYFHDHIRIEHMLFDGAPSPMGGALSPDPDRPGLGLAFKDQDAKQWAVSL